jgi:hypothetical protein
MPSRRRKIGAHAIRHASTMPAGVVWWLENGTTAEGADWDSRQVAPLRVAHRRELILLDAAGSHRAGLRSSNRRARTGGALPSERVAKADTCYGDLMPTSTKKGVPRADGEVGAPVEIKVRFPMRTRQVWATAPPPLVTPSRPYFNAARARIPLTCFRQTGFAGPMPSSESEEILDRLPPSASSARRHLPVLSRRQGFG